MCDIGLSTYYCTIMCPGVEFIRSTGTKIKTNSKDENLLRSLLICQKRGRTSHSLAWCLDPRNTREGKMKNAFLRKLGYKLSTEDPNWNKSKQKVCTPWLFLGEGGKRDWKTGKTFQSGRFQWPLFWPSDLAIKITLKQKILLDITTSIF